MSQTIFEAGLKISIPSIPISAPDSFKQKIKENNLTLSNDDAGIDYQWELTYGAKYQNWWLGISGGMSLLGEQSLSNFTGNSAEKTTVEEKQDNSLFYRFIIGKKVWQVEESTAWLRFMVSPSVSLSKQFSIINHAKNTQKQTVLFQETLIASKSQYGLSYYYNSGRQAAINIELGLVYNQLILENEQIGSFAAMITFFANLSP
jgi:hypothetical protein